MPINLFERLRSMENSIQAAEDALMQFINKLKTLSTESEFYQKQQTLIDLREKELIQLKFIKTGSEIDKKNKLLLFTSTLNVATQLLDNLLILKNEVDNNKNDLSNNEIYKNSNIEKVREAAKKFIPAAHGVFKRSTELTYCLLSQNSLHQFQESINMNLALRVVKHATALVKYPTSTKIKSLLIDQELLTQYLGTSFWRKLTGAVAILCGSSLWLLGAFLIGTAITPQPFAIAMIPIGVALTAAGMLLMKSFNVKASAANNTSAEIKRLTCQANKILPKEEVMLPTEDHNQLSRANNL